MQLTELLAGRDLVNRSEVPVLLSTDAADRIARAQAAVNEAADALDRAKRVEQGRMAQPMSQERQAVLDAAQAELEAANEAALDHLVDFVVESIGSTEFDVLIEALPATPEQRKRYGKELTWDPSRFPVLLVALCLRQPEVDADELEALQEWLAADDRDGEPPVPASVTQLKAKLPDVVWQQLYTAAYRVNRGVNDVPKSLTGSATTRSSEVRSEQP